MTHLFILLTQHNWMSSVPVSDDILWCVASLHGFLRSARQNVVSAQSQHAHAEMYNAAACIQKCLCEFVCVCVCVCLCVCLCVCIWSSDLVMMLTCAAVFTIGQVDSCSWRQLVAFDLNPEWLDLSSHQLRPHFTGKSESLPHLHPARPALTRKHSSSVLSPTRRTIGHLSLGFFVF